MSSRFFYKCLSSAVLIMAFAGVATAQQSIKGRWLITISPRDSASLTTIFVLKKDERGRAGNDLSGGPAAYREASPSSQDDSFSLTWEFEGPLIPSRFVQTRATVVLRGKRTSDTTMAGTALIITDEPDPTSPLGFVTKTGTFTGVLQE